MKTVILIMIVIFCFGCASKSPTASNILTEPHKIGQHHDKAESMADMKDEDKTPLTAEQVKAGVLWVLDSMIQGIAGYHWGWQR